MKREFLIFVIALLLAGCDKKMEVIRPKGFVEDVVLKITPVKDQGKSPLCWVYAMLATIETEHLMQGDSVNLSTDYIARMFLEEQAMELYRDGDDSKLVSMRGVGPMTITLLRRYGAMPHDSYYASKTVNYTVLQRKVEQTVKQCRQRRRTEEQCRDAVEEILNKEIGYLPRMVFMLGAQYTPLEFAHSVCGREEYKTLTSLDEYEYDTDVLLPFEDNRYGCRALNVVPDTLTHSIERSICDKHPVLWEGGPNDNHAVAFIGLGHDANGRKYFIGKNSWGDDNETHGLIYISEGYVKKHTALIVIKSEY